MNRTLIPYRRQSATRDIEFDGERYSISVGFIFDRVVNGAPYGPPLEVFANGPLVGSTMQAIISDACIVISLALQHGITADDLAKSLSRRPRWTDNQEHEGPASVVGLIVEAIQAATEPK